MLRRPRKTAWMHKERFIFVIILKSNSKKIFAEFELEKIRELEFAKTSWTRKKIDRICILGSAGDNKSTLTKGLSLNKILDKEINLACQWHSQ